MVVVSQLFVVVSVSDDSQSGVEFIVVFLKCFFCWGGCQLSGVVVVVLNCVDFGKVGLCQVYVGFDVVWFFVIDVECEYGVCFVFFGLVYYLVE